MQCSCQRPSEAPMLLISYENSKEKTRIDFGFFFKSYSKNGHCLGGTIVKKPSRLCVYVLLKRIRIAIDNRSGRTSRRYRCNGHNKKLTKKKKN